MSMTASLGSFKMCITNYSGAVWTAQVFISAQSSSRPEVTTFVDNGFSSLFGTFLDLWSLGFQKCVRKLSENCQKTVSFKNMSKNCQKCVR